jgi:hypothetical protein
MSGLSTTNIPQIGGGVPKQIQPGNVSAKVLSIYLDRPAFLKNGEYNLILSMEGPDLGDEFEGFFINKDDPSQGRHKGVVGRVKAMEFAFSTGTTKSGIKIDRDQEIMRFLQNLFNTTGNGKWFADQDNKYPTIEELVAAIDREKPLDGQFFNWCIAGKEYDGKNGYKNYDLFLPKFTKDGAPVEKEDVEAAASKLYQFDATKYIKAKTTKKVGSFSGDVPAGSGKSDFDL